MTKMANGQSKGAEELIFGLVGPTGSDLNDLARKIEESLKRFDYESTTFFTTDIFRITNNDEYENFTVAGNEYSRISKFMDWGNELRESSEHNDIMAQHLVSKIKKWREEHKGPSVRSAFILKSLKNPDEVNTLKDLTEFGRALHAEMDCLLSANRSGRSVVGGTMYVTTFPCHNCTKHIVASGLKRVIYVEPYPKSRADDLHGDSISLTPRDTDCVQFLPFIGLGPRRYFDLFSTQMSSGYPIFRKEKIAFQFQDRLKLEDKPKPRLCSTISSYQSGEEEIVTSFEKTIQKLIKIS